MSVRWGFLGTGRIAATVAGDLALGARIGQSARLWALEHFDARASSLRLLEHIRRWSPGLKRP